MGRKIGAIEGLVSIVLFIFNVILGVAGVGLIAVGAIVYEDFKTYTDEKLFENKYLIVPVAISLAAGSLLALLSVLGIGSLCCKKKCMVKAYIVCMVVLFGLEIATAALAALNRDEIKDSALRGIRTALPAAYGPNSRNLTRKAVDKLQETFSCCGGANYTDYTSQMIAPPESCCIAQTAGCASSLSNIEGKGCAQALFDRFKKHAAAIIAFAATFIVIQLVAVAFSVHILKDDHGDFV